MFYVGQKVVCVDDNHFGLDLGETAPRRGVIYTIRAFHGDGDAIFLNEIVNKPHFYNCGTVFAECSWLTCRFRPLTDISVFQKILDDVTKQRERVD